MGRTAWALVMALAVCGLSAGSAVAEPAPGADDVKHGKKVTRDRAVEVGRIKARLATADAELEELAIRAEMAVERYNGERFHLEHAQQEYAAAQAQNEEAERRYESARSDLATFAASFYQSQSRSNPWLNVIGGRGGPQEAMDRAGLAEMMSRHQTGRVQSVEAARTIAGIFKARTTAALREQQDAMRRAEEAKREAEQAVERQRSSVEHISAQKKEAERLLEATRERVQRLEEQRHRAPEHVGSSRGARALRAAMRWLGTPYSWGGGNAAGPTYGIAHGADIMGFDCSGLALYAWDKAGITLDHWTGTQWTSGPRVSLNRLGPGDLVFFAYDTSDPDTIHHVGIYMAEGRMVEAPYTGGRVRISSIWRRGLIGAVRPGG